MKTKVSVRSLWKAFVLTVLFSAGCWLVGVLRCQAAPAQSLAEQEKEIDRKQMRQVYEAIQAYRKKQGDLPTWLSDLVPDFLPDPEVLISPVEKRTGQSRIWEYADPKLKISYIYEFSGNRAGGQVNQTRNPPLTMKEWKTLQMDEFGPATPLLRCHLHDPILSLSFSGEFYETQLFWESDPNTLALVKKLGPGPGEKSKKKLIVNVVDNESGQPLSEVEVTAANRRSELGALPPRSAKTDAQGRCSIPLGGEHLQSWSLSFNKAGYANSPANREGAEADQLPDVFTARLRRAVTVGGLVKDPNGKPVAEAKVIVSAVARDEAGQFVLSEYDSVQADSAGKWSSSSLPSDFKSLSLEITHPRFMPGEFEQGEKDNLEGKTFSKASLLAGKAVLVLEPGIAVAGTVADGDGKPIADAEVGFTDLGETPKKQIVRTDSKGGFDFVSTQVGEFHLIVQAKGYAPAHKPVDVERDLKPIQFALVKATPLKGRIVDSTGQPVEGATVAVQSWNELQLLNWSATTDAEGRFSWDSAPDSAANFSAVKPGYNAVSFNTGAGDEQTITMTQAFRLAGKVVDAETKEPIKSFNLIPGRSWGMADEDSARWERNEQKSGSNGRYEVTLDYPHGGQVKFMVIADGYLPAATPLMSETGWHTHDFELKKGSGPKGIVQSPDGKPVEGAQVAILGVGYLSLSKAGFNNPNPNDVFMVKTDAEGRFSLPAVIASPTIVAVHEQWYAEIKGDELTGSGKIIVQPWGRIEGVARVGTKPWPDQDLMLSDRGFANRVNYDWAAFKVTTDAEGRFAFENVPPGERQLVRLVKTSERSWAHSHITPITVKAGETLKVSFGGTGRTLTGQAVLSDPARKVDFNVGHHSFGTRQPRAPRTFKAPEEYREWEKTPEVKEARKNYRYYALRFDPNGAFRIENIPAGTYDLNIRLHEPGKDEWQPGEMIGSASKEIVVDEIPGGVTDEPLDLGAITIQLKAGPK